MGAPNACVVHDHLARVVVVFGVGVGVGVRRSLAGVRVDSARICPFPGRVLSVRTMGAPNACVVHDHLARVVDVGFAVDVAVLSCSR
jgi:hypothetical protein